MHNPVVRGVAADPSVCRVGDDFFLATSTFDLWPGVRIRHSTNLVDWRIIGAAVTRPAQYRRDGRPGPLMLYAPTLRHHAGRFYVACTNFADDQGNFIVSTDDPAGEWSDAAWVDRHAFDPSLLFADGTCYYTRRTLEPRPDGRLGPVVQAEIDPDTGVLRGPMRELTDNYGGFCANDIEGPHLYRIGGWYYLFSAEGGSWKGHMQTCARSRSPWGPFEPCPRNPVLTHRDRVGHPIQTVGHAELFDAPDGSWWAVTLGTRHDGFTYHHNLGRETFLAPVRWTEDGWPVIGADGALELTMTLDRPLPSPETPVPEPPKDLWTAGWSAVGLPLDAIEGDPATGEVTLPFGAGLDTEPAWAGLGGVFLPQRENTAQLRAGLEEVPAEPAMAGVAVYGDARHHYELLATRTDRGDRRVLLRRRADDLVTEEAVAVPATGPLTFVIDATADRYRFSIQAGEEPAREVGAGSARLLSAETAESFIGCHFALVATGAPALPPARFLGVAAVWESP